MNTERDTEQQVLIIWRDSVHPGDDIDAPHEIRFPISGGESLESVISRLVSANYLARIAGGKATWIVYAGARPLAVVAQQWPAVRFLVAADRSVTSLLNSKSTECHLEFRYWCQADPDEVFECLQHGKALPNKYG